MIYSAKEFGTKQAHRQMGGGWFVLEAGFYISSAGIYACKYAEKAQPDRYDILGSSHQIFHVLVVIGALAHLVGIAKAFEYNHDPGTRLCWIERSLGCEE